MNTVGIHRCLRRSLLSLALGACFAGHVQAQSNTTGTVYGQAASGDRITVVNLDTGLERSTAAGADGNFRFAALPAGRYRVTRVDASGQSSEREVGVNTGSGLIVFLSCWVFV